MTFFLQHDIPDTLMKASLNDVIEDCVTFVGVDLNVAGSSLLRYKAMSQLGLHSSLFVVCIGF